jgi:hypothetical protein
MPRRRRFKGYRITSFYIPNEYDDVAKKAEELKKVEGWSFSELLLHALTEYVEVHYPGNPQLILPSLVDPSEQKPLRLEAKFISQDLQRLVDVLSGKQGEATFRHELRHRAIQQLNKLAKINLRLKDKTVDEVVDKASKVLDNLNEDYQRLEKV